MKMLQAVHAKLTDTVTRWWFKEGFRAGYADASVKCKREVVAGSWFATGHRLGFAAYALHLEPEQALAASLRGIFDNAERTFNFLNKP
jgi:ribosomal protein S12 methylthiotransferase accessory factor YcaO